MTDTTLPPIFYLTPDPLRALGFEQYPNFHIICIDHTPLVEILQAKGLSILCIEKEAGEQNIMPRNTRKLLLLPEVQDFILKRSTREVGIAMFKPNFSLNQALKDTPLATQRTLLSLNNPPSLTTELENKVHFYTLCREHNVPIPDTFLASLSGLDFDDIAGQIGVPFVIQHDRGWFGNRTFFIHTSADLRTAQERFTDRTVKVSRYVDGITMTNNAVITRDGQTLSSFPFLQISDVDAPEEQTPLARLPGSSVGNVWSTPDSWPIQQPEKVVTAIADLSKKIGFILKTKNYRGYWGLDFLVDYKGNVYLQELNARFTASTQMFSQLEQEAFGTSLLEQHYAAFGIPVENTSTQFDLFYQPLAGTRVLARNTEGKDMVIAKALETGRYANDNLDTRLDDSIDIQKLQPNQHLLFAPSTGRIISEDEEIFQVQSTTANKEGLIQLVREYKKRLYSTSID